MTSPIDDRGQFNLHEQFDRLRAREMTLQGSINPMLSSFGDNPETRQYSGRAVPDNWVCPFHPHKK
ncbi:MAG TPA: hypothetical protein DEA71_17475 [Nitrospira sp.]|nr:hypothetical protein [Nitrospira sp.]